MFSVGAPDTSRRMERSRAKNLEVTNSPTTWHGPTVNPFYTSFPSGHTTVAFAAPTVFAMEYKNTKFVPIIASSAATLSGLSRLTENARWASDVLVGAALGYLCGRQVVNNYHRYSKIQSAKARQKGTIRFNSKYFNDEFLLHPYLGIFS